MAFDPSRDRASVEAFYTARRLTELRLRPVEGRFDLAHLLEINRRIFQDLPRLGFDEVTPGAFRPPVPAGRDWVKHRKLEEVGISTHVAYSSMDAAAQAKLADRLSKVDIGTLSGMKTSDFARSIADLYVDLDYLHPFNDGNSRTLREFTRELADKAGFDLCWETLGQSRGGRDVLYVARDLSVNRLALPNVKHSDTRRDLTFTQDQLEGNRDLPELLVSGGRSLLRPKRAVAFEQLDEKVAVEGFPELAPLYRQLHDAQMQSHEAFATSPEAQTKFLAGVRNRMQSALDAGDIGVKPRDRGVQKHPAQLDLDR